MEIRPLGADWDLSEIKAIGHDGSDGCHSSLKIPKCRARTTVARDLVIVLSGNAKRKPLGEVLHERPFDMELSSGRVVGVRIFAVEGEACGRGQFQANLGVEPCDSAG